MTGRGRGKKEPLLPSLSPFNLFFASALTFAQLDWKRFLRRLQLYINGEEKYSKEMN